MLLMWMLTAMIGVMGVMTLFPETASARWLRRVLVDKPADWISRLTPTKIAVALLLLPAFLVLMTSAPELLPLMATVGDAALFVEMLLMLWLASVAGGLRDTWKRIVSFAAAVARLARFATPGRRGARRKRSAKRPSKPSDPADEPGAAWAFA
jgi:hypothetical protein